MERFDIVDDDDRVIGTALRSECHGNPALVHRAAHVLVFNRAGELLLQKRSPHKDIQPGRWDTSVGGHLDPGESYLEAAIREMGEELGVSGLPLTFLYASRIRNDVESENIATYLTCHEGPFVFSRHEIDAVRFWTSTEIDLGVGSGIFTPNFEEEWRMFQDFGRRYGNERGGGPRLCPGDSFPDLFRTLFCGD
jgi:isopentenyldiphosphate isomerase